MDTPESEKNKMFKRTNSNRLFILDEFLGVESEDLFPKESLSFSDDLHRVLETRRLPGFSQEERSSAADMYQARMERKEPSMHVDAWGMKKKRRSSSMFWNYMHGEREVGYPNDTLPFLKRPSEANPQKLFLGVIKKPAVLYEKNTTNSILPLYLNSTTSFEGPTQKSEFMKISKSFIERVGGIEFESLTVQQLKGIMKEFGLNYTGKKQELIGRIRQTYQKIMQKREKEGISGKFMDQVDDLEARPYEESTNNEKAPIGFMFF
ncbi:hypothetical protein NEHOM01_1320 [Nematocida homosporus]|uniref:uncharacterized protein n=1 Tax=Nematocida homosporus TaxID=1912981 RepID=UPI00221EAAB7|nr:uncharacterized protein NEHOM01_1320 [Nematocida homosporus]KAI5186155.1 hypothetical protein NEHOM01_1320 [Nematocida homosporus]